ncbi:MAG: MFS transporter, partial [Desulfobacterales bacterium]
GYLSDRTQSRYGRRRPYIALGSVLVAGSLVLLFNPPQLSPGAATVWFGVFIYALFLFWTVVVVPYESLGPEISFSYHERTGLFALRDGLLIAGTLAAASSPALIQWLFSLSADAAGERAKFFWISALYAPLIILFCWLCVGVVREIPLEVKSGGFKFWKGLRQVARNRPFMILLSAYTISAIGNNLPATLILYYVQYVLQSELADLFLVLYFATGILFLPGWIWISGRSGKKLAWLASMAVNTGAFIGVFFLGPGDGLMYGVLVCISGIGFGATLAIPSAIQADVIDYDELLTGERREGQYIGWWSIAKKLAAALGIGIGLSVLGLVGYQPNVAQTEQVKFTLRILYALVPSLFNLIAFAIALGYPISSQIHGDIREAIVLRRQGRPVRNPLEPSQMLA